MNKNILRQLGFGSVVDGVEAGLCPCCNKKIVMDFFVDELSLKEFQISGMCQECQDSVFNSDEEY
jgi:hypothetical protein